MSPAESRLRGVLVTFRRPEAVRTMLASLAAQTRPLDDLVVVDNDNDPTTQEIVRTTTPGAEYVPVTENLGPAGGIALGMRRLLERACDRDWLVTLDDDNPPVDNTTFATLCEFADAMSGRVPPTAAVGLGGARFDRRKGQMVRIDDTQLRGAVAVDYIPGNQYPLYSVTAVRAVGPFRADLFFGFEELEYGLRLRDAGFALFCHGPTWQARRAAYERLATPLAPSRTLNALTWRRYYALRNLICILRDCGATPAALRVTLITGFAKPLVNQPLRPRQAFRHLHQNARACRDAWMRRMGRVMEPT